MSLADSRPAKTRYVLAVDDSHNTLEEVVAAISSNLGSGKSRKISKEDALLNRDISVRACNCTMSYIVHGGLCMDVKMSASALFLCSNANMISCW